VEENGSEVMEAREASRRKHTQKYAANPAQQGPGLKNSIHSSIRRTTGLLAASLFFDAAPDFS